MRRSIEALEWICRPACISIRVFRTNMDIRFSVRRRVCSESMRRLSDYLQRISFKSPFHSSSRQGASVGWVESTGYMSTSVTPHVTDYIFLFHASGMGRGFQVFQWLERQLFVDAGLLRVSSFSTAGGGKSVSNVQLEGPHQKCCPSWSPAWIVDVS